MEVVKGTEITETVESQEVEQITQEESVPEVKLSETQLRRQALEADHLRLKELEVSVLYEELNTRNLAAVKGRMQHFITIKEIESKYNKLVEQDKAATEKAKQAQEAQEKLMSLVAEQTLESQN